MQPPAPVDDQRDLSYLHCPFLDPAVFIEARAWLALPATWWKPPVRIRPAPPPPPWEQAALATWTERGFTELERDVWLAAGLSRFEAHLAEQCIRAGITVADLYREVDGRLVRHWLRSGESVDAVRARLWNATA